MSSINDVTIRLVPGSERDFVRRNEERGFHFRTGTGDGWSMAVPVEDRNRHGLGVLRDDPDVEEVVTLDSPYKLASLAALGKRSRIELGSTIIGEDGEIVAALRSNHPDRVVASDVVACGATVWSVPGTSSSLYGEASRERLTAAREAADADELSLSVACADEGELQQASEMADMIELEAREMQNFSLLRQAGQLRKPLLLRRGRSATIEEFLLAAEYVLAEGNGRVILCEGVDPSPNGRSSRLELALVALLRRTTHLPVAVDLRGLGATPAMMEALVRASIAAGADAFFLELPRESDPDAFASTRAAIEAGGDVAEAIGRRMHRAVPVVGGAPISRGQAQRLPRSPLEILERTDPALRTVIHDVLGRSPRLEVWRQERIRPPYPTWLRWILKPEGDLLVRWTSYVDGDRILTKNLAYVDFGRVDPSLLDGLQADEINLGDLFAGQAVDKFGFAFGTGAEAGDFEQTLREGHGSGGLHPYVWRRYIASTSGRVGFLVIEALPTRAWDGLLDLSLEARSR